MVGEASFFKIYSMALPKMYEWLNLEDGPRMLIEGLKLYGTKEIVGKEHNPVIIGWAAEVGLEKVYVADEIAWCGLVMAVICKRSNKKVVKDPLWALNWAAWENLAPEPMLGDICTFKRPGGGHVGLYIGEDKTAYHIMGGNQNNGYNITRIAKERLFKARRPKWEIAQPPNVRKIILSSTGDLSTNEA